MEVATKRKLIDIHPAVFDSLTILARGKNMSLKKYIESLLEDEASRRTPHIPSAVKDPRVISLVGMAKHAVNAMDPNDERAQYILSK